MKIGYARVSTDDQSLDLQKDALQSAGVDQIYEEKASARTADRVELGNCLKALREGDTLVVWRLDRLGRSLKDLVSIIEDLGTRGIGFVSLQESIDTTSATGKLIFHIIASLAEFERALTVERVKAGLSAARARGRKGGKPRALSDADMQIVMSLWNDKSISVTSIAERFKISRPALYESVKRYQAENQKFSGRRKDAATN